MKGVDSENKGRNSTITSDNIKIMQFICNNYGFFTYY